MARYIEAENLIEEIKSLNVSVGGKNVFLQTAKESVLRIIDEQLTADVEEVKHGEWFHSSRGFDVSGDYDCSLCQSPSGIKHFYNDEKYLFCPDCGAKMDNTPKERGGEK